MCPRGLRQWSRGAWVAVCHGTVVTRDCQSVPEAIYPWSPAVSPRAEHGTHTRCSVVAVEARSCVPNHSGIPVPGFVHARLSCGSPEPEQEDSGFPSQILGLGGAIENEQAS